jgi:hypothetical protein
MINERSEPKIEEVLFEESKLSDEPRPKREKLIEEVVYEVVYMHGGQPHTVRVTDSADILVALHAFQNDGIDYHVPFDSIQSFKVIEIL